jgi:hypothetical protein
MVYQVCEVSMVIAPVEQGLADRFEDPRFTTTETTDTKIASSLTRSSLA